MKRVKIACAGGVAFHAKDFSKKLLTYPECELAAIWDEDPEHGRKWAEEMGCEYRSGYDMLLEDKEISGIVITSDQADHADLIVRAADAGKHIFVENGLAMTNGEAEQIRDAVERKNIRFILSDPVMKPPFMYAKDLVDRGVLGTLTSARVRISNDEDLENGTIGGVKPAHPFFGGLGHHTMAMLKWFLGEPVSIAAMSSAVCEKARTTGVADNAAAILTFESGAIGIAETGSVSVGWPYEVQLYGTKGCARITKTEMQYHLADGGWITVPENEWPQPYTYILRYWIECIRENKPVERYGIDDAVTFTRMFTAAARSEANATLI